MRLHVVPIQLPALRERGDDILAIARDFLRTCAKEEGKKFSSFSAEVEVLLARYRWPGNVRQLQNVIRNITVLHDDVEVRLEHLPPPLNTALSDTELTELVAAARPGAAADGATDLTVKPLAQVEREAIERAIAMAGGNIPRAAALLDVSPSTIYRKKQVWDSMD